MKVVIQCCAKKHDAAGSFSIDGKMVEFVAHPKPFQKSNKRIQFSPDDKIPNNSITWREHLLAYNSKTENPDKLLEAGHLYNRPSYLNLLNFVGIENLYILSAGWGLVRADFRIPKYDITFDPRADPWKNRAKHNIFRDFTHLTEKNVNQNETIYFFGGQKYLPLYYDLTQCIVARKVIYTAAAEYTKNKSYEYIRYQCRVLRNWHYSCVSDFLANRIRK